MNLNYLVGDATVPQGTEDVKLICHIVNNDGAWGAGFVVALSRKWKEAEKSYRAWYKKRKEQYSDFHLGNNDVVYVENNKIGVVNMLAQDNVTYVRGLPLVDYRALRNCIDKVADLCKSYLKKDTISVHMPRIGCGIAGGDWNIVEDILKDSDLGKLPINVNVYDLPGQPFQVAPKNIVTSDDEFELAGSDVMEPIYGFIYPRGTK